MRLCGAWLVLAGALLAGVAVSDIGHAAGLVGSRGTITVAACAASGGGRASAYRCTGAFVPDPGGGRADAAAWVTTNQDAPGARLRVVQSGDRYREYGFVPAVGPAAVACLGTIAVGGGGAALFARPRRPGDASRFPYRLGAGKIGLRLMVVGAALAVLCLLAGVVGGLLTAVR